MKTRFTFLACLIVLAATTLKGQTTEGFWLRYTVKGEEFSVMLPSEPGMKTVEVSVPHDQKTRVGRVVETHADGVIYTIYSYENLQPRQSLAEFIAEQTANSGLDVSSELKVTAGDFEGKQYSTSDTQRAARTEQFFATENHLYRFVAGTNPGAPPAQKFFGSIMLGKKEDGLEVVEGLPPAIPAGEKVFNTAEVDTKARLTDRPMPTYTDTAKAVGVTGAVNLKVLLGSDGRVTLVRVISGLPFGLTERAIQAAKATKFVPAIKDGKNVSTWVQMEFNFNLF